MDDHRRRPRAPRDALGAALLTARRIRRRRWAELSGAERVGLYTRQSLYVVLWGANGLAVAAAVSSLDDVADVTVLVAGAFVVTAAGFAVLLRAMRPLQPMLNRRIVALSVLGGAFGVVAFASLPHDARDTAIVAIIASVALPLGIFSDRRIPVAVVIGAGVLLGVSGGTVVSVLAGFLAGGGFVYTGRASMWLYGIVTALDTARQAHADLAIAEERLRFSRDVHDVLGRRLSTIAVQAELAATLARRGDEGAPERMLEIRGVAHAALREARELARGYRSTDFPHELDGARSLLRSAGIDVRVSVEAMPRAWQEAAGWIVREAVTNVLRHSTASVVEIRYADGALTVTNDGARPDGTTDGSGVQGLRERLTPLNATLETSSDGDRWSVVTTLPGTGPVSARNVMGIDQ